MYAFTPGQPLCLVYEDFYLAIGYTFYEFIKITGSVKIMENVLMAEKDSRTINFKHAAGGLQDILFSRDETVVSKLSLLCYWTNAFV